MVLTDKHFIGNLCKRGHTYNGTQQSLRYKKGRGCVQCTIDRHYTYITNNKEKHTAYIKSYYKHNKEEILKRQRVYSRQYYWDNKEDINTYQKFYREQQKGLVYFNRTNPEYVRNPAYVEKKK